MSPLNSRNPLPGLAVLLTLSLFGLSALQAQTLTTFTDGSARGDLTRSRSSEAHACSPTTTCEIFEDFDVDDGLWTEYDPQEKVDLDYANDHRLKFDHWIRTDEGYVYRRYAAQDFVIEYDINITDDGGNARMIGPGFSDGCAPSPVNEVANGAFAVYWSGFGQAQITIITYVGGSPEWNFGDPGELPNRIWISMGTTYYVRFEKSGDSLTLSIFSDPSRTTHIQGSPKTVTSVLADTIFSHFYMLNGILAQDNWEWTTGWMDNVRVDCACSAVACDIFEDFDVDDGLWTEFDPQEKIDLDYADDHLLEFANWIRTDEGYVYRRYDGALRHHEAAREIKLELGDRSGVAYDTFRLAEVLRVRGELDAGRRRYEEALRIEEELGNAAAGAEIRLGLARLELSAKNYGDAERHARDAEEVLREAGHIDLVLLAKILQAEIPLRQGVADLSAVRTAIEALRLHAGESQDPRVEFELRLLEARWQFREGEADTSAVRHDLEEMIDRAQAAGYELYARDGRDLLAEVAAPEPGSRLLE